MKLKMATIKLKEAVRNWMWKSSSWWIRLPYSKRRAATRLAVLLSELVREDI